MYYIVFLNVTWVPYVYADSKNFILFLLKFQPNYGDVEKESKKQLDILNHIQNRIPIVDATKAANREILEEQRSR